MCRSVYLCSGRGGGDLELSLQGFRSCQNNNVCYNSDIKHHYINKQGFTLAEVLITLGIIGVVAAMTLPSLINNYREKQFETSFKRTNSQILQALNYTVQQEYGIGDFKEFKTFICGDLAQFDKDQDKQKECLSKVDNELVYFNQVLNKNLGVIGQESITKNIYKHKNYGGSSFDYVNLCSMAADKSPSKCQVYYLKDGSAIFGVSYNEAQFRFIFDTNGPKRGPNRLGYDIFEYEYPQWRDSSIWCSHSDSSWMIGLGCYYFAIRDINAEDKTKGYWDSLY